MKFYTVLVSFLFSSLLMSGCQFPEAAAPVKPVRETVAKNEKSRDDVEAFIEKYRKAAKQSEDAVIKLVTTKDGKDLNHFENELKKPKEAPKPPTDAQEASKRTPIVLPPPEHEFDSNKTLLRSIAQDLEFLNRFDKAAIETIRVEEEKLRAELRLFDDLEEDKAKRADLFLVKVGTEWKCYKFEVR